MVGSAAMLFVLPSTTRLGPQGVFACLFTLGLFQGPFVPAQSMMKRSWVPDGPEKPMMLLLVGLGSKMSRMLSAAVTPVLCAALGWRRASTVYAVCVAAFTAFWQAVARNEPRAAAPELTLQTMEELATPKANGEQIAVGTEPTEKAFESRVFTVAGIQAVMWSHVAANNTEYCLMQWAPSYFNEVLHVPLGQVGGYLAVPAAVNLAGNIAVAAVESALVKTGEQRLPCPSTDKSAPLN
jgi:sugar phosphate permease